MGNITSSMDNTIKNLTPGSVPDQNRMAYAKYASAQVAQGGGKKAAKKAAKKTVKKAAKKPAAKKAPKKK